MIEFGRKSWKAVALATTAAFAMTTVAPPNEDVPVIGSDSLRRRKPGEVGHHDERRLPEQSAVAIEQSVGQLPPSRGYLGEDSADLVRQLDGIARRSWKAAARWFTGSATIAADQEGLGQAEGRTDSGKQA
jgi:hypothetical protein